MTKKSNYTKNEYRGRRTTIGQSYVRSHALRPPAPERHKNLFAFGNWLKHAVGSVMWLVGAAALAFVTVSVVSYSPADPGFSFSVGTDHVDNWFGRSGAWISDALMYVFGASCWWLVLAGLFTLFAEIIPKKLPFRTQHRKSDFSWFAAGVGLICLMLGSCCLERFVSVGFYSSLPVGPGGLIGGYYSGFPIRMIGVYPALCLFILMICLGAALVFRFSWTELCERIGGALGTIGKKRSVKRTEEEDLRIGEEFRQQKRTEPHMHEVSIRPAEPGAKMPESAEDKLEESEKEETRPALSVPVAPAPQTGPQFPIALLAPPDPGVQSVDTDALALTCRLIESKLKTFGIDAQVISARPGPVITQFELQPGEGVKGSKIADVCDDLGRVLGVGNLRLVMNLPGTTSMGLEMPSAVRQTVRISEILASKEFEESKSKLTIALGKDIAGNPYVVDLAKMPHLLVAGTTGSGKSVGINAMIMSILYRSTPDEVRFVMIDPKMVEFSPYEGIPNLLCQVVTDMSKAVNALQWLTREMNRRYAVMRRVAVKRFEAFNEKVRSAEAAGTPILDPFCTTPEASEYLKPWPYIVVVVDELADLILAGSRREVETLITSLAQKARAAGIHLILATQRPSTDVVTPLIKANIPAHIAFQVVTRYDAQVIMGEPGAENLIGNGDMLFRVPGMSSMVRLQGCFVSDSDVENVVKELKTHGEPDYREEVMEKTESEEVQASTDGESDALYDKAVEIVLSTKRPTISSIQRHLSIGYNRAANLIEAMEKAGIVSEPDNSGRRTILVSGRE